MKQYKVNLFKVDRNLGYLIQNVTKDSTQEILGYFYSISQFVLDNIMAKSKAKGWLNKDIILFYKETPISFRIQISCSPPDREAPSCAIEVKFPNKSEAFEVGDLMNAIVEHGLGLSPDGNLPIFSKPELKTPACLKDVRVKQNESR